MVNILSPHVMWRMLPFYISWDMLRNLVWGSERCLRLLPWMGSPVSGVSATDTAVPRNMVGDPGFGIGDMCANAGYDGVDIEAAFDDDDGGNAYEVHWVKADTSQLFWGSSCNGRCVGCRTLVYAGVDWSRVVSRNTAYLCYGEVAEHVRFAYYDDLYWTIRLPKHNRTPRTAFHDCLDDSQMDGDVLDSDGDAVPDVVALSALEDEYGGVGTTELGNTV